MQNRRIETLMIKIFGVTNTFGHFIQMAKSQLILNVLVPT